MKLAKVTVSKKSIEEYSGELLVAIVGRDNKGNLIGEDWLVPVLKGLEKYKEFSGKKNEFIQLYPLCEKNQNTLHCKRLLLAGIGDVENDLQAYEQKELLRIIGGKIAKVCKKNTIGKICISLSKRIGYKPSDLAEYLTEGILLGVYQFLKYKNENSESNTVYPGLKIIEFRGATNMAKVRRRIKNALNYASAANFARNMANEPGNCWTPTHFAESAKEIASKNELKCTILDSSAMKKIGMGGILAVNQGSKEPPKCIILEYSPQKQRGTILLVGKGLTFDSGGISLKPATGMMEMKYDMCGGAAVLAAMEAVAHIKPDVRVIAIVPSTDNMNGGGAIKPGDVITHYGGITSEIENTDAEGRLILADAMAYGKEKYHPDCIVDLATLTGAVIIGLGHHHSGLLSNNDDLVQQLVVAGKNTGEPLWRLPLGEEYAKQIESKIADIKNTGGKSGGCITAAEYLHKFVGDTPWAHLDIAGTAWNFTEKSYIPKGPSGVGARTLIEFIKHWNR